MKHTQGPWEIKVSPSKQHATGELYRIMDSEYGDQIAVIEMTAPFASRQDVKDAVSANANLIAASPELLEIAKAYRNLLKTMAHTDGEVATYQHITEVIAKVEGQ